ncbi:helix-turn-helix transcriptional regulator [uncultured Ruegeria sp.]|uniref:helix-turn-helix domain-containing protein n=1 Tax=uncultured Ruegeria sp. TaxID=259304 RepID=UPI00261B403B|nr:helix-turn-helix transcriptional regulator [uncultured Ruegeria sp.]
MIPEPTSPNVLANHLAAENISQRDFAVLVESHQSIISRIINGRLRPSLEMAFAIERATNGAVPASHWVEVKAAEAAE